MSTWSDAVAATSPYGWWRLTEASGTVAADASGNSHPGTYANTGSLTYNQTGIIPGGDGSALLIHHGFGGLQINSLTLPDVGATYAVTFKGSTQIAGSLFVTDGGRLVVPASGNLSASLQGTTFDLGWAASNLFDGVAHLIVYLVRSTTIELWVDGVLRGSASHSKVSANRGSLNMAASFGAFVGTYDDLTAWTTALSSAQIEDLHDGWLGGPAPIVGTQAIETDTALAGSSVVGIVRAGTTATESDVARAGSSGGHSTIVGSAAVEVDGALAGVTTTLIRGSVAQELSSGGYGLVRIMPPVTPAPLLAAQHSYVVAQAFGAVTMQGSQPIYSISQAATPRARQRIVVDGTDITYFRGGITPNVTYTLLEPLLYGPATLDLPQVAACFERPSVGALSFLRPGAEVVVQRVIDDVVVGTDWKGIIVAFDLSGRNLSVELGGEASGRAALRNRQVPIFPRINDLGRQWADGIKDLGLSFYPPLGPVTGIEVMTSGGTGHHEWLQERIALGWTRSGRQWSVMPDETTGAYEGHRKDDETIHGTVFLDDARTVANLRRDISEEPNRVYPTGVTPAGQRVRFGVYPGLIQGPTPDFPGHMELGDSGDGVRLLIGKLHAMGYLKLAETAGGYDQDVYDAVVDLQIDANLFDEGFTGTAVPGEVNLVTWNALYDLGVTENSLEWAHIEPAAQRRKVRPWIRSGAGGIMGVNPLYDPNHLVRDRNVDLGTGLNRSQMREFARTVLHDSDDPNWVGDITLNAGALIRGEGVEGMTVIEADVMDARELRPGMNLWLPQFDGGTLVHIAAIQVDDEGIVTATVDTRFRDAMEVWEVIARNKESRNDPTRTRQQKHRSSTIVKDSIGEWDEFAGYLGNDIDLVEGWNTFEVIGAMEGTVRQLRIILDTPAEFACAVFGRTIDADRLNNMIPRPLTNFGTGQWETKADELDERWILVSEGTKDEPCGYSPGRKQTRVFDEGTDEETTVIINDPTGKHVGASFPYRSYNRTELTVAVWVAAENKIPIQRILWPQMEAGV